jgi:hypothetical protein
MPLTAIKLDKSDRRLYVKSEDDVEPILEHNKALRSQEQKSDWGRSIANVPTVILLQWLNEAWESGHDIRYLSEEWYRLVWKKLQDPDWKFLRTD